MTLVSLPLTETDVSPGPIAALKAYSARAGPAGRRAGRRMRGREPRGMGEARGGGQDAEKVSDSRRPAKLVARFCWRRSRLTVARPPAVRRNICISRAPRPIGKSPVQGGMNPKCNIGGGGGIQPHIDLSTDVGVSGVEANHKGGGCCLVRSVQHYIDFGCQRSSNVLGDGRSRGGSEPYFLLTHSANGEHVLAVKISAGFEALPRWRPTKVVRCGGLSSRPRCWPKSTTAVDFW